jgi:hypothetical protein
MWPPPRLPWNEPAGRNEHADERSRAAGQAWQRRSRSSRTQSGRRRRREVEDRRGVRRHASGRSTLRVLHDDAAGASGDEDEAHQAPRGALHVGTNSMGASSCSTNGVSCLRPIARHGQKFDAMPPTARARPPREQRAGGRRPGADRTPSHGGREPALNRLIRRLPRRSDFRPQGHERRRPPTANTMKASAPTRGDGPPSRRATVAEAGSRRRDVSCAHRAGSLSP